MKLLVPEEGRDLIADTIARSDAAATARLSYAECHAALYRASRAGRIGSRQTATAARRFAERWASLVVVELDDQLCRSTARLCRDHELRGSDAVHLASALEIAGDEEGAVFACFDRRLWEAAGELGLERVPASSP